MSFHMTVKHQNKQYKICDKGYYCRLAISSMSKHRHKSYYWIIIQIQNIY